MLDDFLIRAALAGMGVALATAPLGCFVVWRRMAYFGEATAHAGIMGVALALALGLPMAPAILISALLMASAVAVLTGRGYAMDTALGVLAHATLAIGILAASLFTSGRLDLQSFLFGDILAVGKTDLAMIWSSAAIIVGVLAWRWSPLLAATLNPDLARASGIDPRREEWVLTMVLALTVAMAIKVVGVLLVAAMLIIPPAAARPLTQTPEGMAAVAALIAGTSALGGLAASYQFDSPAGPSIVCFATVLFLITVAFRKS